MSLLEIRKAIIRMPGDVHINAPLSNVSIAYMQSTAGFIADRVFPNIPVEKQSDIFWKYSRADWNRTKMKKRAPATESAGAGFGTTRDQYYADVWALHHDISDQTRGNADTIFNLDSDATKFLTQNALLTREASFAAKFLVAGAWGDNEATGITTGIPTADQFLAWNDPASTPVEDVRARKRQIQAQTGFRPNKLTLGARVYDALVDHPDIIDRIKYGQTPNGAAVVNKQAIAALLEMDEILVAEAVVNTGGGEGETVPEASDFVVGDNALLSYAPPAAGLMVPSAGYTFSWRGYTGASDAGGRVSKFRMEELKADRVEIEMAYDQKQIAQDLGFLFVDAYNAA